MNSLPLVFLADLQHAPDKPGCYLFFDEHGRVLYVGKAKSIHRRVQVYRKKGADGRQRFHNLLADATSADFRVTSSEKEALLLESNLVKAHQPPLNVLLKDDKSFLYLTLDQSHIYPRIGFARKRRKQGDFFGPYPSASSARQAKRFLKQAFGLRDCSDHTLANRSRPCLQAEVGLCSAPCVGHITQEEYKESVRGAIHVLKGNVEERLRVEATKMKQASERMEYESALRAQTRMTALRALGDPQRVQLDSKRNFDVLGLDERGEFVVLEYRGGTWLHTRHGTIPWAESRETALASLIPALYSAQNDFPVEILLPSPPDSEETLLSWLHEKAGHRVRFSYPKRGEKKALLRMAESNARARKGVLSSAQWVEVSARLADRLHIPPPRVVDCVDISHLQGNETVASKVRFIEGRPEPAQWRRFRLSEAVGNNDFLAMEEVVERIFARASEEGLADLLVLDGGPGQLSSAWKVIPASHPSGSVVALAKSRKGKGPLQAEERIYRKGHSDPLILDSQTPERLFLERIRNEAHRFAITYHRKRRENLRLVLEQVPGVGPARRKLLLDFCKGDLTLLKNTPAQDLMSLPGIHQGIAQDVLAHLRRVLP
ncbi:MAG: excinuclease ABC subunit UvrC [Planctomycetota bacterium]|nr:excinuclease ABC subunit UvrC [Planctomycetota bacterium]